MVSKERMNSSLSGLPSVLLALLLVLRFPGEKAAGAPGSQTTSFITPEPACAMRIQLIADRFLLKAAEEAENS